MSNHKRTANLAPGVSNINPIRQRVWLVHRSTVHKPKLEHDSMYRVCNASCQEWVKLSLNFTRSSWTFHQTCSKTTHKFRLDTYLVYVLTVCTPPGHKERTISRAMKFTFWEKTCTKFRERFLPLRHHFVTAWSGFPAQLQNPLSWLVSLLPFLFQRGILHINWPYGGRTWQDRGFKGAVCFGQIMLL